MLLASLSVTNYRCFARLVDLPFERITGFIGPNDSGKSSILLLLQHCLKDVPLPEADFRDPGEPIVVELRFAVTRAHEAEKAQPFMRSERELWVRKEFAPGGRPSTTVYRCCYDDPRLNALAALKVPELDDLLSDLGIMTRPRPKTRDERLQLIADHVERVAPPRREDWMSAGPELAEILPEFLIFGADEDLSLQAGPLVTTLKQVYRHFLQHEPPPELKALQEKADARLQEAVATINPVIQHFAGHGLELIVRPTLDLVNGLNLGEVQVRTPTGEVRAFSRCGDGTKRRIVLGLFHWSNRVLGKIAEEQQRSLLWCFDEPDTHLYYKAQHELLRIVRGLAAEQMQVVLCTHSVSIIDRLSPKSVRHMLPDAASRRTEIEYVGPADAEGGDIEAFLQSVGRGMGFPNSLLFYERCFLIVEGDTEDKALPILYRTLHGEEMIEHGLHVFSAESDAAAINLARVLHRRGKEVILLLDQDTEQQHAGMIKKLAKRGFDTGTRLIYVGSREFEDAFCDEALLQCLNARYARQDGREWTAEDLRELRAITRGERQGKFSAELMATVGKASGKNASKPEFGRQLAECLDEPRLIPAGIRTAFARMRAIADAGEQDALDAVAGPDDLTGVLADALASTQHEGEA